MFLEEFKPVAQEFCKQPVAFAGGFVSGLLRLKLTDDPLKSWLQKQGVTDFSGASFTQPGGAPRSGSLRDRPQSISID